MNRVIWKFVVKYGENIGIDENMTLRLLVGELIKEKVRNQEMIMDYARIMGPPDARFRCLGRFTG